MSGGFKITQPKTNYVGLVSNSSSSGSAGSSLIIDDEGTPLATAATTLDFVGAGVTATGAGATKTITIPGGAAFATPAIVLGTAAAAGAATTVIRSDSTIAAFDATVPATQALGDAAATGSVAKAARRDHLHGMPALSTATPLVESGTGAVGTAAPSSREDHVHPAAVATGRWEVVMTVGITDPPEPVWNVAGDDWLYVFIPS